MFYDESILDDGLTVITESIDSVRSVAIGIWFSVGSRDELPAEAGMSHFLEHMMFKGTPTRTAQEISEAFDRLGAELNAFTSKEYTCYYARVLDQHVDDSLDILSEMVTSSLLAEDACVSEREVVLEEIARTEDSPDDRVHELFASALWPGHPIGLPVLGRADAVSAFGHEATASYRGRHYTTGNTVVAAAGNVAHDDVVALVREHLAMSPGPRVDRPSARDATPERLTLLSKETEQAHICYGVPGLHSRHADRFVLSVFDTIMGGGMSSRLFQEIREKKGLAYAVYSYHGLYQDTGQYTMYAGTRPSNAEEVVGLMSAEVDKMLESGVTADELDRAKESIKGHLVLGLENTRNRMTRLGKTSVTGGELLSVDELVERVEAVTGDDVLRIARQLLGAPHTLAVIGPFEQGTLDHLAV